MKNSILLFIILITFQTLSQEIIIIDDPVGPGACPSGSILYYYDNDGDGYGNSAFSACLYNPQMGYVLIGGDCDDTDPEINPGTKWYADFDGDGFGDPSNFLIQCTQPPNYVLNNNDNCVGVYGTNQGCPSTTQNLPPNLSFNFSDHNYIFSRTYKSTMLSSVNISSPNDIIENITYFDGIGRPSQEILISHAPNLKDIVKTIYYDAYGRNSRNYLSYPETNVNPGFFVSGDIKVKTNSYHKNNYSNDFFNTLLENVNAFSATEYDSSPLGRVEAVGAPGKDWRLGSGNEKVINNDVNRIEDAVRNIHVTFPNGPENPFLNFAHYYMQPEGTLSKIIEKNENYISGKLNTTETYKDKEGKIILQRKFSLVNGIVEPHETYYVYDTYGLLSFIIPPKVVLADGISVDEINELCYHYKYDKRDRLIEKKIPGKEWEFFVYDTLDQLILIQDGNLRATGKWLYNKYDGLGRNVEQGIFSGNITTRSAMQSALNLYYSSTSTSTPYEKKTILSANHYYTNNSYPTTNREVLFLNYYDNYVFENNLLKLTENTLVFQEPVTYKVRGLPTGSKIKILDQNPEQWIISVNHYDKKGRLLYNASYNDLLETTDKVKMELDFTGIVKKTETYHKKGSSPAITVIDNYTYDHATRLTQHTQTIGGKTELIADNTYSETGELMVKKVGNKLSAPLQTVNYSYNIRGWLKQINDPAILDTDLFAFKINYNTTEMGVSGVQPLYNGNISETTWRTANTENSYSQRKRGYSYQYDALNRLTNGHFRRANATGTLFNEETNHYNVTGITYDKNGNIGKLNRRGVVNTSNGIGDMDKLDYIYQTNSNKLMAVQELSGGSGSYGFINGSTSATEYSYDVNGNLISDANKGIWTGGIKYNHLNLPTEVKFNNSTSQVIKYTYDATGVKLKKEIPGKVTEYAGNFVYEKIGTGSNGLQFVNHPEGYVSYVGGQFNYVYNYKDHLGNVRLSYTDNNGNGIIETGSTYTEIVQEKNYYPFGLEHKGYNTSGSPLGNDAAKRYGFGGKELQSENISGIILDWYDVSARNYDPALGRWMNLDPLAKMMPEWSPYNFAFNNPIRYVDPLGLAPEDWVKKGDQWMWDENITSAEQATAAGYDDYRAPGSIIDNATINGERGNNGKSSVYLGQNASDVSHTYPNSTITPFQVGKEWLFGEGPRNRDFKDGDYFTKLLKQHDHVNSTVGSITNELANGGRIGLSGSEPYSLGGVPGVGKYVKDYSTLATAGQAGNLAVTYLGSYSLNWSVTDITNGSATIQFRVSNSSTMQSAFRPPVLGYLPIWQNTAGNTINNYFSTGWGSKTSQTFNWTQTIKID